jgi:flagellin-specific chaperone FliS
MIDKNWTVMNDIQEAFNNINTLDFLLGKLQQAVDENDTTQIVDVIAALNSFLPIYEEEFNRKFKQAWTQIIGNPQ